MTMSASFTIASTTNRTPGCEETMRISRKSATTAPHKRRRPRAQRNSLISGLVSEFNPNIARDHHQPAVPGLTLRSVVIGLILAFAIGAGGAYFYLYLQGSNAGNAFYVNPVAHALFFLLVGVVNVVVGAIHRPWALDGSYLLISSEVGGNWDIYAIRPDGTERLRISCHDGDVRAPAWTEHTPLAD